MLNVAHGNWAIQIRDRKNRIKPDPDRLSIAGLTLVGFIAWLIARFTGQSE
jgi:hypothetical protein